MLCLLVVLFFAVTGITLNHPEWSIGGRESRREVTGTLAPGFMAAGKPDWLKIVEQLRKDQPVHGSAVEMRIDGDQGSLAFKAPGYAAETFFETATGKYQMTITAQGVVGVMNDLHRGRDSGASWAWLIDLSGVLLTIVSLTGFAILFYLKKARVMGVLTALAGLVVLAVLAWLASK